MLRLIARDESKYWRLDVLPPVDKIYARYVYNDEEHTYCAELTPSRWLKFIDFYPIHHLEDEKDIEKLDEILTTNCSDEFDMYMHCSHADKFPHHVLKCDTMEEAIEYCRGNVFLPEGL